MMSELGLEFARRQSEEFKRQIEIIMEMWQKQKDEYESRLALLEKVRETGDRYVMYRNSLGCAGADKYRIEFESVLKAAKLEAPTK